MKMPEKDPGVIRLLLDWAFAWAEVHSPTLYGLLLALVISWLRVTYAGGGLRQRIMESLLCGAISLAVMSGMDMLGIPATASGFVGGVVGFLGVDQLRDVAMRWLDRRSDNGSN